MKGHFIALYGVNNLGKTTQATQLVDWLHSIEIPAVYIKYPVYEWPPTGELINEYLRKGNPQGWSPQEFQEYQAQNRRDFQPNLQKLLEDGYWVIAEDYEGTGRAWGEAAGIDVDYLNKINSDLTKPDLCFCFIGERFKQSIETTHLHETDNDFTDKAAEIHYRLAKEEQWILVDANEEIDKIHKYLTSTIQIEFPTFFK